jgi:CRP-like cAMP-binding protein
LTSDLALRAFVQQVFGCRPETAQGLLQRATERLCPARTVVLRQGDALGETWLIVRGRAQAVAYSTEGQLVLLQEYGPGEIFGDIAEAVPVPQPADIEAVEDLRAITIPAEDFQQLIEANGELGLGVTRLLTSQLRRAADRMVERTTLSAVGRVNAELLRMGMPVTGGELVIRPVPVFSSLAVRVHSTRETVSRNISALERRGLIRREDNALFIVAPRRLRELVV